MAKKTRKKKKRTQSKVSRILSSTNKKEVVLRKYFKNLTPYQIKSNIKSIHSHRFFKAATHLTLFQNYNDIYANFTPRSNLPNNLLWCLGIVTNFPEKIRFFLEKEQSITIDLLEGNFDQVILALDEIDDFCGLSTWSISIRCSVLSHCKDNEQVDNFLNNLEEQSKGNAFFHAVAKDIGSRYQESSLFTTNIYSLRGQLNRYLDGEILHFLMFKLIPHDFSFNYDYEHVFNREKNSSIIDIFTALIDYVSYAKSRGETKFDEYSQFIISELNKYYTFAPIQGFANSYGISTKWIFSEQEFILLDEYTEGHYGQIKSTFQDSDKHYSKFAAFELFSKTCARSGEKLSGGLIENILDSLVNIYLKNDEYNDSLSYLLLLCHCFSSLSWFKELYFLLVKETQFLERQTLDNISTVSSCYSAMNSPLKTEMMPDFLAKEYMEEMQTAINDSSSLEFFKLIKNSDPEINKDGISKLVEANRFKKYQSISFIKNGQYDDAVKLLKELVISDDQITSHEASKLVSEAYILKGDLEEALDFFVNKSIDNPNLILCFDTHKICSVAKEMINSSASITIPIALSLHSRYVDSEYNPILKYSFEVFLNKNGVKNPIELVGENHTFDQTYLNYFLEYVCTPDVMKLYLFFTSTSEIENCRIEVCKYLIENGVNKDSLVDEVKERTRLLIIRKAVKQVENSRIYADTSSFRISRAKSFKQLFDTYKEICLQDFSSQPDELQLDKIYQALKASNVLSGQHSIFLPNLTLNEKNATFINLLRRLRDEFTFGDKGLNINLSTRIRHGHLPTTLRKCVTDERLVTAKHPKSKKFKANTYWLEKLNFQNDRQKEKVEKAFNTFSENYDKLICEVNDSWLQIWCIDQNLSRIAKDESKKQALFNYSVSPIEAYSLQKKLSPESEYDDFLKVAVTWLWERTEINLEIVKNQISNDVRQSIYDIMDEFQKEVLEIVVDQKLASELFNALGRARSALSPNIEQILSWFTRSEGTIVEKFDFDTAIDIAQRSANIQVAYTDDSNIDFDGKTLNFFVDILYILFENAISKSNIPKEDVVINVSLETDQESNIVLLVDNNCKITDSVQDSNQKLQFYRDSYGKEKIIRDNVQGEGGTGFFKICKILTKDLEVKHYNEFGYAEESKFNVKLTILESSKVIHHENSHN